MYQTQLTDIRKRYKEDAPLPSIAAITGVLEDLRHRLRPYVWTEAEPVGNPAPVHSFDEALERPGASANGVLSVGARAATDGGNAAAPATAVYTFDLPIAGAYDLWVAAQIADPGALTFRMDGEPLLPGARPEARGATYANGLVWYRVGTAALPAGRRRLEIVVGPGVAAAIDALLLTRDAFSPDGPNPPPVVSPELMAAVKNAKQQQRRK
jgi:hypothetical protein